MPDAVTNSAELWLSLPPGDERVRALFDAILAAPPADRQGILANARSLCPTTASEVESLLLYHDEDYALLDEGAPAAAARLAGHHEKPKQIGRYLILREIGHGGMGVVYEASQEFPKRRVALKVIRPELVSRALLRRFEHEAEALAAVQHPAIAQLYEAGYELATPADPSQPAARVAFIAMELVTGRPLTDAAAPLDIPARVALLARVCDAVDHAHRRGVIHRDLKPGNILVDDLGNPRILDFGIAKLADDSSSPRTIETHAGQIVGTLGYMAPEQLAGDSRALDIRCDVYALGVLLYQSLCGAQPVDVSGMSLVRAAAAVRETEPLPLGKHDPRLRGDLEAIAAHALEKAPDRRYASAHELALDLRRHLHDEPVSARPLTAFYHAGKFASRHRGLVSALAAIFVSLAAGAIVASWLAAQAHSAAAVAKARADETDRTRLFLWNLLESATPEFAKGRPLSMRQAVDQAATNLDNTKDMTPRERASIHNMLGKIYVSLYEHQQALNHYAASADLQEATLGPTTPEALHARMLTIWPLAALGRYREAWDLANRLYPVARRELGDNSEITVDLQSSIALSAHESLGIPRDEMLRLQNNACTVLAAHYGPQSVEADRERMNLGVMLMRFDRLGEALPILSDCLRWRRENLGNDHPSVLVALSNYGGALNNATRYTEAASILDEAVHASERIIGVTAIATANRRRDLATALAQSGDLAQAERHMRTQLDLAHAVVGATPDDVSDWRGFLVTCVLAQGRLNEAEREIALLYTQCLKDFGPSDRRTLKVITLEFDLRERLGDVEGMKDCAKRLKDSPWGDAAMKQAEEAASQRGN